MKKIQVRTVSVSVAGGCNCCKTGVTLAEKLGHLDYDYDTVVVIRIGNMLSTLCETCYGQLRETIVDFKPSSN